MLAAGAQVSLQVDEFTGWLNPKGNRELALRNTLTKWWPHIVPGIRKRLSVRQLVVLPYLVREGLSFGRHLTPGPEQYCETSRSSSEYTCQARWYDGYFTSTIHDMDQPQSSKRILAAFFQ